jgi:hypothetical protein
MTKSNLLKLSVIAVILVIILTSCASQKAGCPSNVAKWEARTKFNK